MQLRDVDIEKVLVSSKTSFDKKNYERFTGYLYNNDKRKPLDIVFPKTCAYASYDGKTKWIYFLIEDDDLLKRYNTI